MNREHPSRSDFAPSLNMLNASARVAFGITVPSFQSRKTVCVDVPAITVEEVDRGPSPDRENRSRSQSPSKPPRRSLTEKAVASPERFRANHASIRRSKTPVGLAFQKRLVPSVIVPPNPTEKRRVEEKPAPKMVQDEKPMNLCGFILLPAKHANEEPDLLESKDFKIGATCEIVVFRKTWPVVQHAASLERKTVKSDLCLPLLERVENSVYSDDKSEIHNEKLRDKLRAYREEKRNDQKKVDKIASEKATSPSNKWYTSVDKEGRLYYYEENSNESVWVLPDVQPSTQEVTPVLPKRSQVDTVSDNIKNPPSPLLRPIEKRPPKENPVDRKNQAKSQIFFDSGFQLGTAGRTEPVHRTSSLPRDATQIPYLNVLRQGQLNKTKITENGKKLRKNWSTSYAILSDQMLLLYKDAKTATQSRSASSSSKPELSLDLNGATVEWCSNKSSRKNVFQLSTYFGLQLLLQDEDGIGARQWFEAIRSAISQLPCGLEPPKPDLNSSSSSEYLDRSPGGMLGLPVDDGKKSKLTRTRSTKSKFGSVDDLTEIDGDNRNVRDRLRKLFGRRPTIDALAKKGIWKAEPVFGSTLRALSLSEKGTVPKFVQKVISVIESKQDYLETDGLYRASGNLSQVQKIRLNADQYSFDCIDTEEDVHVLAGALKLFFRELIEPAIPTTSFGKALEIAGIKNKNDRVKKFKELLHSFPKENYDTLKFLFTHLLRVTDFRDKNRMQISNLAIVFGPTLMWPETESANLALDMMQQNMVIECLLLEFKHIFTK